MRAAGLTRALAAAPWAALDAAATGLYGVLFVLVVGWLVGPAELGLASSALAFVLLAEALSAAGLQDAVIRLPSADTRQTDAAHSLAMLLSFAAVPIVCGAAWLYGLATGEPRLLPLTALAAVMLPFNAAACVPTALLVRKMRGRQLLIRPLAGKLAGMAVLLVVAVSGGRASAVVAASVATSLGGTAALWIATTRRPRLRWHGPAAAAQLRFGLFAGTDSLFWLIGVRLFTLAFGAGFGMSALGYLQLALRLVEELSRLLQSIIMRYALALFAEIRRTGADAGRALLLAMRVMNAPAVAVFAGLACVGDLAVVAIVGQRWAEAGGYTKLLGVAAVLTFARLLVAPALKAIGRPDRVALAAVLNLATALAVIATLPFVAPRVAVTLWAARELFALAIWSRLAHRHLGLSYRDLARALAPSWAAGAVMAAVLLGLRPATERLALLMPAGAIVYAVMLWGCERTPLAAWWRGAKGGRWRRSMS